MEVSSILPSDHTITTIVHVCEIVSFAANLMAWLLDLQVPLPTELGPFCWTDETTISVPTSWEGMWHISPFRDNS